MSTSMVDAVLGKLRYDVIWKGKIELGDLARKVPLHVDVVEEGERPSDAQRQAFTQFIQAMPVLVLRAQDMIYEQAQNQRSQLEPKLLKYLPKTPNEVWGSVKIESVLVPVQKKKGPRSITMECSCKWEPEHGFSVLVQDGVPVRLIETGEGF